MPLSDNGGSPPSWLGLPPPYDSRDFSDFLERRRVAVLDVVHGAVPGTRRLLVGDPGTGTVGYAIAVGRGRGEESPLAREQEVLSRLDDRVRHDLRTTMPRVVEHVEVVAGVDGLVVTGVPGLGSVGRRPPKPPPRDQLAAVDAWLAALWRDAAGSPAPVALGAAATGVALSRYDQGSRLEPALEALRAARSRVAGHQAPRVLSHGCLCLRHTMFEGHRVVGVDDWALASTAADPLLDLGEFAVQLAGARLPEVIAGRSSYAAGFRHFVRSGLSRLELPPVLWRDVLVLAQVGLALRALENEDNEGILRLARAVSVLPSRHRPA